MVDLELYHHGVLGMKWGVRNAETKARYLRNDKTAQKRGQKLLNRSAKITDKQIGLAKKIQKKQRKIIEHPNTPAVTFDYNQGFNLVFGARAHAIKKMKLDEMIEPIYLSSIVFNISIVLSQGSPSKYLLSIASANPLSLGVVFNTVIDDCNFLASIGPKIAIASDDLISSKISINSTIL